MRHFLALSILMLTSVGACFANDPATWDAVALSEWVGKYPTTTENKASVSILAVRPVKEIIDQIVPASERKLLATYHVESPVMMMGNFIVIKKCKPHDCPFEHAMVVIDLEKKRLWAGFFTRNDVRTATRWYGNGEDYSVLPAQIKKEFLSRHGD